MTQRPGEHIDWNINQAGGSEVAPTNAERDDGYAVGNVLRRQLWNWLANRVGRWFRYLEERIARPGDILEDGALAGYGSAPTTGAGLTVASGSFSARVVINGLGIGPVDGPARTYTPSTDTYWDLDRDGVWHAVEVNAGDAEPGVTANAIRCYLVTTDASDRTAVQDRRARRVMRTGTFAPGGGFGFHNPGGRQVMSYSGVSTGTSERIIYQHSASPLVFPSSSAIEISVNALWFPGVSTQWVSLNASEPSYIYVFSNRGLVILYRAAGAGAWDDNISTGWTVISSMEFVSGTPQVVVDTVMAQALTTVGPSGYIYSSGNIDADGDIRSASAVGFDTAQNRQLAVAGTAGLPSLLTEDAATGWLRNGESLRTTRTGGATLRAIYHLSLPSGAVITSASVFGSANGPNDITLLRIPNSGTPTTLLSGTFSSITNGQMSLTVVGSLSDRTVSNNDFGYALVVEHHTASALTEIRRVRVGYQVTDL